MSSWYSVISSLSLDAMPGMTDAVGQLIVERCSNFQWTRQSTRTIRHMFDATLTFCSDSAIVAWAQIPRRP